LLDALPVLLEVLGRGHRHPVQAGRQVVPRPAHHREEGVVGLEDPVLLARDHADDGGPEQGGELLAAGAVVNLARVVVTHRRLRLPAAGALRARRVCHLDGANRADSPRPWLRSPASGASRDGTLRTGRASRASGPEVEVTGGPWVR